MRSKSLIAYYGFVFFSILTTSCSNEYVSSSSRDVYKSNLRLRKNGNFTIVIDCGKDCSKGTRKYSGIIKDTTVEFDVIKEMDAVDSTFLKSAEGSFKIKRMGRLIKKGSLLKNETINCLEFGSIRYCPKE